MNSIQELLDAEPMTPMRLADIMADVIRRCAQDAFLTYNQVAQATTKAGDASKNAS